MSILDKFKVDKKTNGIDYPIMKTRDNLGLNYNQVKDAARITRDKLEQEFPGKYEMSVAVKTSVFGWRSGKFSPTNHDYLYIYSLDIYDKVKEEHKKYLKGNLVYDEIHFIIREIKKYF